MEKEENIYKTILKSGSVIALVGGTSSGKTNALYQFITSIKDSKVNKCTYFYHEEYNNAFEDMQHVSCMEDLERITNSIIFIDEFAELFKIEDRRFLPLIKTMFAQIKHNNNKLVICGLPDYFRKFIAAEVDEWVLFDISFNKIVNGSALKLFVQQLAVSFKGLTRLNVGVGNMLWRGKRYVTKYAAEFDRKENNINDLL